MKYIAFSLLVLFGVITSHAQINLQPIIPQSGIVTKNHLWNVVVINSGNQTYDCQLAMILRDRLTGEEIISAVTNSFTVTTGAQSVNVGKLQPILYNTLIPGFAQSFENYIPPGKYTICYSLNGDRLKDVVLAEECLPLDITPLTSPQLAFPSDSSDLEISPTQFGWTQPAPFGMFSNLEYEIIFCEVKLGQSAVEALNSNPIFYKEAYLQKNYYTHQGFSPGFEKNKWYAWQVVATDGSHYREETEAWVFKIKEPGIRQMLGEFAPFVRMTRGSDNNALAINHFLRLDYFNESNDSLVVVEISESNSNDASLGNFPISIGNGTNQKELDLRKLGLKEQQSYEARITNSRREIWKLRFKVIKL